MTPTAQIQQLAKWLQVGNTVAFTGAGISTESGIPDFRSPGGVWSRHKPVMFHDFLNNPAERRRYWQIRKESVPAYLAAKPNAGHHTLARLEEMGRLRGVITQNIDELHQRAGSSRVIEVHGTAMRVACLSCARRWECQEIQSRVEAGDEDPVCDSCGGMLKSMTISFGQAMPQEIFQEAIEWAGDCDLFLAIGSSLVVQPAASLPLVAKRAGARVVIINREPTPLDDDADLVIHAPIGQTLSSVLEGMST
jgi:NAD-dependent deacetylase